VLTDFPAWIAYSVLPVSLALMCYRFVMVCGAELLRVFKPTPVESVE
jgi:TRAP-type C4-dicarboxylate transport system permease small subunit